MRVNSINNNNFSSNRTSKSQNQIAFTGVQDMALAVADAIATSQAYAATGEAKYLKRVIKDVETFVKDADYDFFVHQGKAMLELEMPAGHETYSHGTTKLKETAERYIENFGNSVKAKIEGFRLFEREMLQAAKRERGDGPYYSDLERFIEGLEPKFTLSEVESIQK